MQADPGVPNFLTGPKVSASEKVVIIPKALQDRLPRLFVRFLGAVIANRRQQLIPQIASEYALLVDALKGRVHARVTVSLEPTDALRARLEKTLGTITGQRLLPQFAGTPALFGGVSSRRGDPGERGEVGPRAVKM